MSSQSIGLPTCSLSTLVSRYIPTPKLSQIARATHFDGLDLDYSGRPLPPPRDIATQLATDSLLVRSVWIPRTSRWSLWRPDAGGVFASAVAALTSATYLVTPLPQGAGSALASLSVVRRVNGLRRADIHGRMVLAVSSEQLVGGRIHLRQMTLLRHLAEEWDFWLGLDMLGPIDPRWEAEAVVALLGPRLCLVRTVGDVLIRPDNPLTRPAKRALTAIIDDGHPRDIALRPDLSFPQRLWPAAVERACRASASSVQHRIGLVESDRVVEMPGVPPSHHVG